MSFSEVVLKHKKFLQRNNVFKLGTPNISEFAIGTVRKAI